MAHRFSRAEKGKWTEDSSRDRRRPVRIQASDNSALIEENKLTLIGRVTNPAVQKTQWVVDWLVQYWNVEGELSGRELGPELFQIRFTSEEALQSVLRKGPYHYKRWMILLQRWEPVVSNSFPRMIAFWVRIHGLPLHYWTLGPITTIGEELGHILDKDVEHGRVRVLIDGLKKLEMRLPLELDGEVIKVDLEYEKLEKHCFICYSLCHERESCPLNRDGSTDTVAVRGISQQNTLRKLEDHRRRHDSRRSNSVSSRDRMADTRDHQQHSQRSVHSRLQETVRSRGPTSDRARSHGSREEGRRVFDDHRNMGGRIHERETSSHHSFHSHGIHSPGRRSARRTSPSHLSKDNYRQQASEQRSQSSRTPPPRPPRELMHLPAAPELVEVNSRSGDRIPALERIEERTEPPTTRISALERLEEATTHSGGRISALERIEPPVEETQRNAGISNALRARMQEEELQFMEEELVNPMLGEGASRGNSHQEPQRTPASQRLGSSSVGKRNPLREAARKALQARQALQVKKVNKKPSTGRVTGATRGRGNRSPLQGLRISRQLVGGGRTGVKKRLCVEQNDQSQNLPLNKDDRETIRKKTAGTSRGRVDFQNPPNLIP